VAAGNRGVPGTLGTAAEWRGRTILVPFGTVTFANAMIALAGLGLTPADVNLVNMDPSPGLQAFLGGQGDIYFASSTFASTLAARPGFVVVNTMQGMDAGMAGNIIVGRDYLTQNEDILVTYLEGALELMFWLGNPANINQTAEWFITVMREEFGIAMTHEEAVTNIRQIGFRDIAFYEYLVARGSDGLTGLQREFRKFFEYHVIAGIQVAENWNLIRDSIDARFLERALANYKARHNIR
jgi:hypothetical protein